MNIPNILTLLRFLLVPVFGYFFLKENYLIAVAVFLTASFTDILDGYIARKYGMVTSWGKLADPLADKMMQISALVLLTIRDRIPALILGIFAVKEFLMIIGGIFLLKKENFVASSSWYGKLATVIFQFAVIMLLIDAPYAQVYIFAALAAALFAFAMYLKRFRHIRDTNRRQNA